MADQGERAPKPITREDLAGAAKAGDQGKKAKADAYLKQVRAKLQAEVAAGKIPAEDANNKMTAIKKKAGAKTKVGEQGKKRSRHSSIGEQK